MTALFWEIIDNMTFLAFCLAGMTLSYFIGKIIEEHAEFMRFCKFADSLREQDSACDVRGDGECVSTGPCIHSPQCVACGTPLDGEHMEYCYDSDNGFHVRPLANL